MNKKTLALICLTAISCKTIPKDFPEIPKPTLKQPIIEQQFCNKGTCITKSLCREFSLDSNNQWVFLADHELRFCHGIFGVNSGELVEIKNFGREVKVWIQNQCVK